MKHIIKKGILYVPTFKEAKAIHKDLISKYPESKIRQYQLGFAVQYYTSGPYFPKLENES